MFRLLIFISFLFMSLNGISQENYTINSKKAIKLFQEGERLFTLRNVPEAVKKLEAAIDVDSNFIEAHIVVAEAYLDMKDFKNSILHSSFAIRHNPDLFPKIFVLLAEAEFSLGNYTEAINAASIYKTKKDNSPMSIKKANLIISNSSFAREAVKNPVPFKPLNLGNNINSEFDEYWPCLSVDEQTLVFTVQLPVDVNLPNGNNGLSVQEDFYLSNKKDSVWQMRENFGPPLNTPGNEGAQSLSIDGTRIYFTACNRTTGLGMCDIYFTRLLDDAWIVPLNLGSPVNSKYSEKQPSISADGRTLYFVSDRPGGKGGLDIWTSNLDDNGKWSNPTNLGDSVNTAFNEQSPFIHFDNQTLYFSSEGWPGMGSYDIFMTRKDSSGWHTPKNVGYPINTEFSETGLIVNAQGHMAFFSSDRLAGKGRDIYEFELYKTARPTTVSYMKGNVFNSETKAAVSAKFELIDIATANTLIQSKSNKKGQFLVSVPADHDYALNVSAKGYLFYSDNFSLIGTNDKTKPFLKDVPLQPIKPGVKIVLKNIFYETNSFELKNTSIAELSKLVQFMNENPTVKIEVSGHTDNIGKDAINLKLSENRAKSVFDYLIKNGIDISRLTFKGYGKTMPIGENNTEQGRSQNRRTEIKVTAN